ncbi:MAG: TonB-dependent receptor [Phenylobacterium sp.]|nr:TonB-dependent receptor [Phenylobacterium sp.]
MQPVGGLRSRALRAGLMMTAATFAASQAHAQSQPSAAAPASSVVEEVVVTAQRREERLQDVPVAISAFSGEHLARTGIQSTQDLTQITPGLNFTQSSFSPQATIRGVGTRGAAIGDESVVPIFIDGVYQPFMFGSIFDLNDVERIEVLRGPQSTLYGRNATGGAINIVTRTPTTTPSAELGVRYGSFNMTDVSGYVSGGLGPVASDLAVRWRRDDGYVHDIFLKKTVGKLDNVSLRSKTVYHVTDSFDLIATAAYSNIRDDSGVSAQPVEGDTVGRRFFPNTVVATGYREVARTYASTLKELIGSGSLSANYRGGSVDLHAITGYTYGKVKGLTDTDMTPANVSALNFFLKSQSVYEEVYANSHYDGPFNWIVGAVYFEDVSKGAPSESLNASTTAGPTFGQVTVTDVVSRVKTNSVAGYAQLDYKFTDQWSLSLGGRYTREKKAFDTRSTAVNTTTGAIVSVGPLSNQKTWSQFTPTGTLTFKPNRDFNFYLRAGQGFKSGVFNTAGTNVTPVNPEKITQYEVGAKAQLAPWLRANLAVYYTKQRDVQLNARDPVTGSVFLQNAASTRIYGLEADVAIHPTDRLNLWASMSGLHGEYVSFPNASVTIPQTAVNPTPATACMTGTGALLGGNRSLICDVSGNNIIRTPFLTASFGGEYSVPLSVGDLTFTGNWYYSGHSYWDPLNRLKEPAYNDVNAKIFWTAPGGRYEFGVWGENLTDDHRPLSEVTSGTTDNKLFVRPRSYGVEVKAKF